MARPKSINPEGEVKALFVLVPLELHNEMLSEAKERKVPIAQIARERLARD